MHAPGRREPRGRWTMLRLCYKPPPAPPPARAAPTGPPPRPGAAWIISSPTSTSAAKIQVQCRHHRALRPSFRRLSRVKQVAVPESCSSTPGRASISSATASSGCSSRHRILELSPPPRGTVRRRAPAAGASPGSFWHGRTVMVVRHDARWSGHYTHHGERRCAQEVALEIAAVCLFGGLGGAFRRAGRVFPDRIIRRIFYNHARMSAIGIPQLAW